MPVKTGTFAFVTIMLQISAIALYFCLALTVGIVSTRRHTSSAGFLMGNRSLNYWLTALAAHASDMSNWLFMGYPAVIFLSGVFGSWVAIGLTLCMFLNWQYIAPKIRGITEKTQSLTLSSFFEKRLQDRSGALRMVSGGICFFFYTIYIAAGLTGLGILGESLFGISYKVGIFSGIAIVVGYVLVGGFVTLAWLDLFQGLFLMLVIIFVPLYVMQGLGGFSQILETLQASSHPLSLFPDFSGATLLTILSVSLGWGLGYFGQPHIVTKFMGIRSVDEISKSKRVGMAWMICSLAAATLVGLVGFCYFPFGLANPETVFIEMVRRSFSPFFIGLILCAIIAAIINVMSSQLLVLSSIVSEDFYRKIFHKKASEKKLLLVSRLGIVGASLVALAIASGGFSSIFTLVEYAWAGLGASFGPLLLYLLYSKKATKAGAWTGMISGGCLAAAWPLIDPLLPISLHPLFPAFIVSLFLNWAVTQLTSYSSTEADSVQEWT